MKQLPVVVAALLVLIAAAAPRAAQEPSPVHLVIDAVAFDSRGLSVMDLTPGEIEVWIAGYRVPIASLRTVTGGQDRAGRSVVLVLDDVTVPLPVIPRVREIARRFVERMMPGDTMAIVSFDAKRSAEMTGDKKRLLETIELYNLPTPAMRTIDGLGEQVLGVVADVARQSAGEEPRRTAIVAIGTAALFDRPIPAPQIGRELRAEWTAAMRAAALANASLYIIDPVGLAVGRRAIGGDDGFARETGGYAFYSTNDFNGAVERIMREAGNYYLIEVADPPAQRKADLRELQLRVRRAGVTIRARRGITGTEAR